MKTLQIYIQVDQHFENVETSQHFYDCTAFWKKFSNHKIEKCFSWILRQSGHFKLDIVTSIIMLQFSLIVFIILYCGTWELSVLSVLLWGLWPICWYSMWWVKNNYVFPLSLVHFFLHSIPVQLFHDTFVGVGSCGTSCVGNLFTMTC